MQHESLAALATYQRSSLTNEIFSASMRSYMVAGWNG